MGVNITGDLISGAFGLIDDLFTSDEEREAAKLKVMQLNAENKLKHMEVAMSAIITEGQSKDPWTSRARPSFLYVVYILLLTSIPMGVLYAVSPDTANNITTGFQEWLNAIPEAIIDLFTIVMLGYTGARTVEKVKKVTK